MYYLCISLQYNLVPAHGMKAMLNLRNGIVTLYGSSHPQEINRHYKRKCNIISNKNYQKYSMLTLIKGAKIS